MSVIKSGSSGNVAVVTDEGQLLTKAVAESTLEEASDEFGQAFAWTTAFATGGTTIEIITVENDSSERHLHLDQIIMSCISSTVFRIIQVTSGVPAGTTTTAVNLNFGSGNEAESISFGNASVTGSVSGTTIATFRLTSSTTQVFDIGGSVILLKGDIITIQTDIDTTVEASIIGHFGEA